MVGPEATPLPGAPPSGSRFKPDQRHGSRKKFREGRITPTPPPNDPLRQAKRASKNFHIWLNNEGKKLEGKEAGERSEPRKFGVFGQKNCPKINTSSVR